MRTIIFCSLVGLTVSMSSGASAQISCADDLTKKSAPELVIECLKTMQASINTTVAPIPDGAVVAFDRPDGCPSDEGWVPFDTAAGRMIVGVGQKVDVEGEYKLLYGPQGAEYETGGSEAVLITDEALPLHWHYVGTGYQSADLSPWGVGPLEYKAGKSIGGPIQESVVPAGKTSTHPARMKDDEQDMVSVMSPYVALYFCKKETPKVGGG